VLDAYTILGKTAFSLDTWCLSKPWGICRIDIIA
jgi:hypothetical protein